MKGISKKRIKIISTVIIILLFLFDVLSIVIIPLLLYIIWRPFKNIKNYWLRLMLSTVTVSLLLIIVLLYAIGAIIAYGIPKREPLVIRSEEDLERVTGMDFPEVSLVDSAYHVFIGQYHYEVKFKVKDRRKLDAVLSKHNDSWVVTDDEYYYQIFPDNNFKDFDIRRGDSNRIIEVEGDFLPDNDGDFIEVSIPKESDTITVRYGFCF